MDSCVIQTHPGSQTSVESSLPTFRACRLLNPLASRRILFCTVLPRFRHQTREMFYARRTLMQRMLSIILHRECTHETCKRGERTFLGEHGRGHQRSPRRAASARARWSPLQTSSARIESTTVRLVHVFFLRGIKLVSVLRHLLFKRQLRRHAPPPIMCPSRRQ